MRNNLQLYHKFLHQICQWLPEERITRKRNLALLVVGLYLGAAVHLPLIVRKWPFEAKVPSLVNRLHRFLSNPLLRPQVCYQPLAEQLIRAFGGQTLRLVIDTTKVGFDYRALVVGLAYRKRTLPLAWSVHEGSSGNVAVAKIIPLLKTVHQMVPSNCEVELTGDAAFRVTDLLFWLRQHQWHYIIRQRKESLVRYPEGDWFPIAQIPIRPGQTRVVGWVWLAKTNPFGLTWLVLHWAKGEDEPWILVSDYQDQKQVVSAYRRRMWIEEMYGDMKGHGFDLEATHLRDVERIERLMLGVCIAFVWLITLGSWVVKNSLRHLIDHKSRRDKSYFRLGWDWVERCIRLGLPIRLHFKPYL
jgi:hypothetical protein